MLDRIHPSSVCAAMSVDLVSWNLMLDDGRQYSTMVDGIWRGGGGNNRIFRFARLPTGAVASKMKQDNNHDPKAKKT